MSRTPNDQNPNGLNRKMPLSLNHIMLDEIEKEALNLGISSQGFIRLCVKMYFKAGGIKPYQLIAEG